MLFFDTSVLIKAYTTEPGTPIVHAILKRLNGRMALTRFVALEVLTTLAKHVRSKQIGKGAYNAARTEFLRNFPINFKIVEVEERILSLAFLLTDQHRQHSVGAMDALHIASALHLQSLNPSRPLIVASSDAGFLNLAKACGLGTFDPETQPLASLLSLLN